MKRSLKSKLAKLISSEKRKIQRISRNIKEIDLILEPLADNYYLSKIKVSNGARSLVLAEQSSDPAAAVRKSFSKLQTLVQKKSVINNLSINEVA